MKVRDLIRELLVQDPEAEVHFQYPSGDYWRTELAGKVETVTKDATIEWSEYHREYSLPRGDHDDEQQPKDGQNKVVLLG